MAEEVTNIEQQEAQEQTQTVQQDGSGDGGQEQQPDTVKMTQDELDALINKAFARGARAGKREVTQAEQPKEEAKEDKTASEAQRKLEEANQKLLKGSVRSIAADIGLTDKGANVAVKMADFEDCWDDNGDLLDDEVKDVLAEFLKGYPEFAAQKKDAPPMYAAGTGQTPMNDGGMPTFRESQTKLNEHRIIK